MPEDNDQDTAPVTVQRQSVRTAFQQQDPPGANRPGTPPPATPARAGSLGAAAADVATPPSGAPLPPAPVPPPAPEPLPPPVLPTVVRRPVSQTSSVATPSSVPPVARESSPFGERPASSSGFDFGDVLGAETTETTAARGRSRFDPTALVLIVVVVVVIIGVVLAFRALFASIDPGTTPTDADPAPTTSAPAAPPPDAAAPEQQAPPVGGAPVIASATSIDPSDGDGEHEEDVAKAYDSDPATFWYTMTYKRDDFAGFKDAVGYAVTLTTKTTVSTVTLHANGTGGNVEIRATDAANPTGGPVLASGPFGPDAVFTLNPATETQSLVLWVTQLPTAPDGGFRLELTEIALS